MGYYRQDTDKSFWGKFFHEYSKNDNFTLLDKTYFIQNTLPNAYATGEFWWKDLLSYHFHEHFDKFPQQSSYIRINYDLIHAISQEGAQINAKDKGGNTLLNYLVQTIFERNSDYFFAVEDLDKIIGLFDNPLEPNNAQQNFFWYLNTISFTYLKPEEMLQPLIDKYNIDITQKNKQGLDLLDKAICDNLEESADFYLKKGLNILNKTAVLDYFLLNFHPNSECVLTQLFNQALTLNDPFDKYVCPRSQTPSESIIHTWTSFIQGKPHQDTYAEKVLYVLQKIRENKVLLKPKNQKKIKKELLAFKKQVQTHGFNRNLSISQVLDLVEKTQIHIDKYFLSKSIKKSMTNNVIKSFKI